MVNFIEAILQPHTWVRVVEVIVGAVLIWLALVGSDPAMRLGAALHKVGKL